jgi:hypothetical protein
MNSNRILVSAGRGDPPLDETTLDTYLRAAVAAYCQRYNQEPNDISLPGAITHGNTYTLDGRDYTVSPFRASGGTVQVGRRP